jgi:hypothetical protein
MNESDANRAMVDMANLRTLPSDPFEVTQPLPVMVRRGRQAEARGMCENGTEGLALAVERQCWPDFRDGRPRTEADYHARNQRDGFGDE